MKFLISAFTLSVLSFSFIASQAFSATVTPSFTVDGATKLPTLPRSGTVLVDLGNRLNFTLDAVSGIDSSLCSSSYKPVEITAPTHLTIGSESYLLKRWFCTPSEVQGKLDSISIQAENETFHSKIYLNVYPDRTEILDNRAIRPTTITSRY